MLKNAFLGRRDEPVSAPVVNSRPALGTRMTASVLAAMVRVSAMSAALVCVLSVLPVLTTEAMASTPGGARIEFDGLAPYKQAREPYVDDQGRTRVIVDFVGAAQDAYFEAARGDIERFEPGRDRHNPVALRLIEDYERRFGIEPRFRTNARGEPERSNLTTWVGASLTAYLTNEQIEGLRRDANVRLVTADVAVVLSSAPPWAPSWNGSAWTELNDWGWHAVQGKSLASGSTRKVYIAEAARLVVSHHQSLDQQREARRGFAARAHGTDLLKEIIA